MNSELAATTSELVSSYWTYPLLPKSSTRRRPFVSATAMQLFLLIFALLVGGARTVTAQTFGCSPAKANDIVCENSKTGNPSSEWDITGAGDPTIQGYATDISVNQGSTVYFKINTNAKAYTIDIYRMGYYGGMGARKVASVTPSVTLPQTQPTCLSDSTTFLVDCGNWAVSASWVVPSNATSGVYFAHLVRTDTGGENHIVFIVRNDASHSDILFQTADESWQAYNNYGAGGFSLYGDNGTFDLPNRATKVSYNRPFVTRGFDNESATWVFGAEYPMIRWMESNGYDVTYFTGIDAARSGALIKNHKIYTTAGHDEYWSGPHRANVEAARDAGVNMAFFSGNEVFWKTRLEPSIDPSHTPNRTLVCYKETLAFAKIDPQSTWTGTWRDPSFSPPSDGGRPENSLTGTIFMVNGPGSDNDGSQTIKVPAADGKMRFWRNTAVASLAAGATYTMPLGTLGYEWDVDADNGARPAGAFQLSTTTYTLTADYLLDWGATYGAGTATHHLMMYRAKPNGALVFGAGTVQWAWGLDSNHDNPFGFNNPAPDVNMQQATVNLFADMGVQPATLQGGLLFASKSTDTVAPTARITSPSSGAIISASSPTVISGTATDTGGGVVAGVEVSVDGGTTWHPASGRGSWSYTWTPTTLGAATILARATDDSANLGASSTGVSVTVAAHDCPCNVWNSSSTPTLIDSGDGGSIEVGVKFRADYAGYITGIRFYKGSANTGTHIGNLWSSTGTLLATATFTGETASGWQQVTFGTPVAIAANTTYVASYFAPNGHYSADGAFFATKGLDNPPIHLLKAGVDGPNGVYNYGSASIFPNSTYNSSNYWVDVAYIPAGSMPGAPPSLLANPSTLAFAAFIGLPNPATQTVSVYNQGSGVINYTTSSNSSWLTVSPSSGGTPASLNVSVNPSGLAAGNYSATLTISSASGTQTVAVSLSVANLFLNSNFATSDLEGWIPSPLGLLGNWSISNSTLNYNGNGPTQLYAGNSAWTDYSVSATFKLSSAANYPGGIRGRINSTTGASYIAWLYPATGNVRLFKNTTWSIDTGSLVQLGIGSASFDTTNFHTLQMSFAGSQIQVFYDGKLIITATDTANTAGYVALDVYNQPISFSKVLVTSSATNTGSYTVAPASLTFNTNYLAGNPAAQTAQITSATPLAWTAVSSASWLTVTPVNGVSPGTLQVGVLSSTLSPGTYTGTIQVVSLGAVATTKLISVTLNVIAPPPTLLVSPASLNFTALTGQASPAAQTLSITNGGSGGFSYTVSANVPWVSMSPTSGAAPGAVSVSVSSTGLATGSYSGTITVTATGIANSPITIPVSMQVLTQDLSENFSGNGAGWIVSPMGNAGGWSSAGGVYSYNGSGLSQTCAGNTNWTDYAFDANIKLSNLSNWPGGLRARVNPTTGAGYVVWLYPGSGLAVLYKVGAWNINDPSLTQLGSGVVSFDTTAAHDLSIAFSGSLITVSWDGRTLFSATDATYTKGFVCLDANSQPISYSNVRVLGSQSQLTVDTPSPSTLTFSALPGNPPAPQVLNITAGGASTTWSATKDQPWLTVTASSSLTPGTLTVTANPTGLVEGNYSGTVKVYVPGASNSPLVLPVTLGVHTAILSVTPTSLNYFGAVGVNPNPQSVQITNVGTGTLNWTASGTQNWLGLGSTSGVAPSSLSVSPVTTGLPVGNYTDTITVSSPNVGNGPIPVSVSMLVGNLLFSDDFSSGSGNWTVGPLGLNSGWSVVNGVYAYNGGGHTQSWAGDNTWTDYTVGVDVKLASLSNYPGGIRGRVNTATGACYAVWIYPAQGLLRLFRVDQWNIDTSNAQLGVSAPLLMDTNTHNIRLKFKGNAISVYYDNALVISATDATYTQGAVALDVSNQPINFDNVTVISAP